MEGKKGSLSGFESWSDISSTYLDITLSALLSAATSAIGGGCD